MEARYQRQILLESLGAQGQSRLGNASVLVIGAGGLGCPILQYLAAAGVGTIGIIDGDTVELSNLHRQVLYNMDDIGSLKALAAASKLQAMNDEITIKVKAETLNQGNAFESIQPYDMVIDGTDNFISRYVINDACAILKKPLIYGAVMKFEGQVAIFNTPDSQGNACNYRDLFPTAPVNSEQFSCNATGVLGTVPGIIGMMQANEALKLITGIGNPLINQLLTINLLDYSSYKIEIPFTENKPYAMPSDRATFESFDYEWFCNQMQDGEINAETALEWVKSHAAILVDVREPSEAPQITLYPSVKCPLSTINDNLDILKTGQKLIFVCASGSRSLKAIQQLKPMLPDYEMFSIHGGLTRMTQDQISF